MRLSVLLLSLLCCLPGSALAWSNHALGSALALAGEPDMGDRVQVERLEDFLAAQAEGLERLLDEQEAFARGHFPGYPARPDALRWRADGGGDRRQAFLEALRVNPQAKLAYFIQALPGSDDWQGRALLPREQVMLFRNQGPWAAWQFRAVQPGEQLAALTVLASAADEPDYGLDINLFSDNPGDLGARYNFGTQAFGDPRFEYSSQAPFHIGYYHEPAIVFAAGPFLKRTFPEVRAWQYFGLARFAFDNGHPYWGYRFLGWALHYIQDLTQPYHATVMPGNDAFGLLWISLQDLLGFPAAKQAAITRIADRHTELEQFQFDWLRQLLTRNDAGHPMLQAYADRSGDAAYPPFDSGYLRQVVAAEARSSADALDQQLGAWLQPAQRPRGFSGGNQLPDNEAVDPQLQALLVQLIRHFGAHTRNTVRAVQAQ